MIIIDDTGTDGFGCLRPWYTVWMPGTDDYAEGPSIGKALSNFIRKYGYC